MKYTRRDFIKLGSLMGFGSGLVSAFANRTFGQKLFSPSSSFYRESFAVQNSESFMQFVGNEFIIYSENRAINSVLTEVSSLKTSQKKWSGECFSLVFELPENNLGQDTYEIFHPSLGKFELFLVPGKSPKNSYLFIAVINRI